MNKTLKNVIIGVISCIAIVLLCNFSYNLNNKKESKVSATPFTDMNKITDKKMVYLSDIPYIKELSSVGWGNITLDQNLEAKYNNGLIALIVNGQQKIFLKGISAHATSTMVYDITGLNFDHFSTYYGIDASRGTNGNGVKFAIYTSTDGANWELHTPVSPGVKKGNSEAEFIDIDIKGKNYIKLYCHNNGNDTADHCVYGGAKLYKDDYVESDANKPYSFIKTLDEYDAILRNATQEELLTTKEQVLLQRKFVSLFGYDLLQGVAHLDEEKKATIEWLMTDLDALRYYITGGKPIGSYMSSLNVLVRLYSTYKDDLKDTTRTDYTVLGDLYKRMMISLSLTHSANVCLWVGGNQCSDAVVRYGIYKKMRAENLLVNSTFETLNIEEMRWVMNNNIDDEEIEWLNHHIRKFPTNTMPYNIDPYRYITYRFGYNYRLDKYYNASNYDAWNKKYDLSDYNITYKAGNPKLWIVFEEGSVCGGISKTGSNINGSLGNPSAVIGQPGHAAYLEYYEYESGKGAWRIKNDVSGWTASEKGERMLAGWGSNNWDSYYQVTYVSYAQEALNHLDEYNKALETMLLVDLYQGDLVKLEQIYRKALEYQSYNMDAWYGLIRTYQQNESKTAKDYIDLVKELADNMYYFPVPMFDLLNLMNNNLKGTEYYATYTNYLRMSLEKGTTSGTGNNPSPIYHHALTRQMANYLLGKNDYSIAKFSFDGANAKKIVLGSKYEGNGVRWEYSLDGGQNWVATSENQVLLTDEEINSITVDNDIKIHIVGVDYSAENIYTIDITNGTISNNLYNNDLENRVVGVDLTYEWRMNDSDPWTSYATSSPNLTGDKTVQVRVGYTGTKIASESVTFTFTQDQQDPKRKYVPVSHLSIHSVSTQATNNGGAAINAIDGNYKTRYHSDWNGHDTERYIVIKVDKPIYLSALEFVPASGGNGKIYDGTVWGSMDGENWEVLSTQKNLTYRSNHDSIDQAIVDIKNFEVETPKQVQYVKIVADRTNGNWFAARAFNLYHDVTVDPRPTAGIAYSTTDYTNGDVVARLVNFSGPDIEQELDIEILSEGGDTHVFTANGEFTFRFRDKNSNLEGSAKAVVWWIDKENPTATIEFSTQKPTNEDVVVTLKPSEEVTVLNNGSSDGDNPNADPFSYTFLENGEFIFEFEDRAGNRGTATAKVDWIDRNRPIGTISYDINSLTNRDVTATITFDKPNVTVVNNKGLTTHTFTNNGRFEFIYIDEAGNVGTKLAYVNWIDKVAPTVKITYSTTTTTEGPVTVTISSDEDITITNNGGSNKYTFTENGVFEFTYVDALGNKAKAITRVNWIKKPTTPKPDVPSQPDNNPSDKPNNPDTNVPDNKPGDTPEIPDDVIEREYSLPNIKVSILSDVLGDNISLKQNRLLLSGSLKEKFDSNSEYFELYLESAEQEKLVIPSAKIKISITLDDNKEFLGVYEVVSGTVKELNYKKSNENQIEVQTEALGEYIISYKKKDNIKVSEPEKKKNNKIIWIIIVIIGLVSIVNIINLIKKNKK